MYHLLPLYSTATKSNIVTPPGEYVGNFDYLLKHRAHDVIASAKCHNGLLCESMTSSTKPEVNNVLHCHRRRTEPRQHLTCTENIVKFRHVVIEICERTATADRHANIFTAVLRTRTGCEVIVSIYYSIESPKVSHSSNAANYY